MAINKASEIFTDLKLGLGQGCGAIEVVDPTPRGLRLARKPDGQTTLQVANHYTKGTMGGFIWVDVPTVDIDWQGNELEVKNTLPS